MILPKNLILPELPFSYKGLEPIISEETVRTHYLGHHAGYVKTFNSLIAGKDDDLRLFNYLGHLLHTLYWRNLASYQSTSPHGLLLERILEQWGGVQEFIDEIIDNALQIKGSGWTLVTKSSYSNRLRIVDIPNHELDISLRRNCSPVLVIDAWEHAYYLDHKNDKRAFFEEFVYLIDWIEAEKRFVS